jgi:hypothetical protein
MYLIAARMADNLNRELQITGRRETEGNNGEPVSAMDFRGTWNNSSAVVP